MTDNANESLHELALRVAGPLGDNLERAERLVAWMNGEFEWTDTDYVERTVAEILARGGGNCAEQARVLAALMGEAGIQRRWVREINLQPSNEQRQKDAEALMEQRGNRGSVFGRLHNDHRWLEVLDEGLVEWIPADPTVGAFGEEEWAAARLGFGARPEAAGDMLVPFVILAGEEGKEKDRSRHYLVDLFDRVHRRGLSKLPAWAGWVAQVETLSKLGAAAFNGEVNLHAHFGEMEALAETYQQLGEQYAQSAHSN